VFRGRYGISEVLQVNSRRRATKECVVKFVIVDHVPILAVLTFMIANAVATPGTATIGQFLTRQRVAH
jgi:hypothetical protein